jgi:hypothetical protein
MSGERINVDIFHEGTFLGAGTWDKSDKILTVNTIGRGELQKMDARAHALQERLFRESLKMSLVVDKPYIHIIATGFWQITLGYGTGTFQPETPADQPSPANI